MENTNHVSEIPMSSSPKKLTGLLSKLSFGILTALLFLIPFFFIPSSLVSFQISKSVLVMVGVVLAAIFFIINLIKEGKVTVPKNLFFLSIAILPIVFLISSIAHGAQAVQLIGYSLDSGTVAFVFFATLLLYLVTESFEKKEHVFKAYIAFFASFVVVGLYQLLRLLFGPDILSFGLFTTSIGNLVGNWNDLGIFFGLSTILSLVSLEMLSLSRLYKTILYSVFAFSIFFLMFVNFVTIWMVLAVFALIFFVYIISFDKFSSSEKFVEGAVSGEGHLHTRKISYNALALLVISVLFVIAGQTLGTKISSVSKINNIEVRPSWGTTLTIIGSALKDNAIVGTGPNGFTQAWLVHKPAGINESLFWNTDFSYGIGLIPTFFVTTGVLGIVAWVFFFVMFILVGVRAIYYSLSDLFSRFLITSSFMAALFLWIMSVLYVPSTATFALAFFFTGLFAANLRREGLLKVKTLSLVNHPKLSFVSVLVLVALLICNVTLGYFVIEKVVADVSFQQGVSVAQTGQNLDVAQNYMVKAVGISNYDKYYRGLSQVNLLEVNQLLSKPGATPESIKDPFQQTLGSAIENARQATLVNPTNYQNWLALAQVYASLVPAPFAIPGAYENAKAAYESAQRVSPNDPTIVLLLARLEVAHKDLEKARVYANQAVEMKKNFADAHFLLAQIEASEGNVAKAIPPLQTTLILSPNNPGLFFQLGLLEYDQKDYASAIDAFARAIIQVPDYANAKYFLGLALQKTGRVADALQQFKEIAVSNPDNVDIKNIITNLEAGKDPFANVPAPKNHPEKAATPPLPQKN